MTYEPWGGGGLAGVFLCLFGRPNQYLALYCVKVYSDKLTQVQVIINSWYVHLSRNTRPLFRRAVLNDDMSQSELTTIFQKKFDF